MKSINANACPQLTTLRQFLRAELAVDQEEVIDAHVAGCRACLEVLDSLSGHVKGLTAIECLLKQRASEVLAAGRGASTAQRRLRVCNSHGQSKRGEDVLSPKPGESCPASIGAFRVVRELGRGAYGVVYHAHDDALDRPVAIKVPHADVIRVAGGIDLYLKEAKALARLDHPNIVRVYEAKAEGSGSCYVVSQFIMGCDLATYLAEAHVEPAEAARLIASLADALQHAHERGIYHRDVKPANVLLDQAGIPYLADFGLALRESEIGRGPRLLGTPAYMSPEQARSQGHHVDGRTDIYSLGVVFYSLLTGRRPFLATCPDELLRLIAHVDVPSARQKNRLVPKELDRICAKALARTLSDRYRSASDLADDLNAWLSAQTPQANHGITFRAGSASTARADDPMAITDDRRSGRSIGGFQLQARLGRGGMGVVYRARQPSADREVAVKCLTVEEDTARARFLGEIRMLASVDHPNLVRVYTAGSNSSRLHYAMELVEGTDFAILLSHLPKLPGNALDDETWHAAVAKAADESRAQEEPLEDDEVDAVPLLSAAERRAKDYLNGANGDVCRSDGYVRRMAMILRDVALATQALHDKGVIHRDIKPDNIRLARDGNRAVLMDLGIAKIVSDEQDRLTRTHQFVGSVRYASPEQVIDSGQVDHRTDVYSLGATLWELLALRPIYGIGDDVSDARAMLKIEIEEPEPIRKFNRAVSRDLQAIVQKCLEKDPLRRYQSAGELAEDLQRFLHGLPVLARPVGPAARFYRRCRRRPAIPALTLAIALLSAGLGAALVPAPKPQANQMRIGIKPWVGFCPLVVAAELGLCEGVNVKLVPVRSTSDVQQRILARELEIAPYLIDSHALARANHIPTKVILQLDTSLTADAIVAGEEVKSFADLKGRSIAYMHHEAPHFLLLSLCEKYQLNPDDLRHVKTETAKEAVDLFLAGKADAVVSYEPFLKGALARPGARRLASAKNDPGSIIDILTVREDYLESERRKVQSLIAGWFKGLELLERGDPDAMRIVCRFLGTDGHPISVAEYNEMASGMKYAGRAENLDFFRIDAHGQSTFRERISAAQRRWDRHHQLSRFTDPSEGDGSDVIVEMCE